MCYDSIALFYIGNNNCLRDKNERETLILFLTSIIIIIDYV